MRPITRIFTQTRSTMDIIPKTNLQRYPNPRFIPSINLNISSSRRFATSTRLSRAPVPSSPPPSNTLPRNGISSATSSTSTVGRISSSSGSSSMTNAGSGTASGKKRNGYTVWYREIVPAMIPPLLLSFTLFLTLSLLRTHLSHERSLSDSTERIQQLELELDRLSKEAKRNRERERRERERILPIVVGKVLQRVGVLGEHLEEGDLEGTQEEERLLV